MTASDDVQRSSPKAGEVAIPQYGIPNILLMYAWPVAWFAFLIYVIGPSFVRPDGTFPLWGHNLIGVLGNGAELVVALIILRREGHRLRPKALLSRTLRARINLRFPDKLWKWGACVGAFIVAVGLVMLAVPLETKIATLLPPPDWMPDHPLHEVSTLQGPSEDRNPAGQVLFWIFQFVVIGLILNYLGEGLYYRAALQPKLRGVFGRWAWVAAGVGFGLKHLYFWWRVPYLVPVGLALAFLYGPMGSLPLALFFHWLGNAL
jgi:membrane protease YdiL (CAAX protease family)